MSHRIVPPPRFYRCLKCRATMLGRGNIEEKECPTCHHIQLIHKKCGGNIIKDDLNMRLY